MQVISIVNQKGGVGKTTTAVSLASYLSLLGKFVLLVDLDPQANATSGLGVDYRRLEKGVYEAIINQLSFREIIYSTNIDGLRIAPATPALAGANVELVNFENREFQLKNCLVEAQNGYDYIIIDCPPSLGILTINGLAASERVLIPVQAEYYALEGLAQLLETISLVKENLRPDLDILGAVITMYDKRHRLSYEVMQELYRYFPNKIFRTVIPRNIRLAEAPSYGQAIWEYDRKSKGARSYEKLTRELLEII